jgi:GT2 family glycosyltransferase
MSDFADIMIVTYNRLSLTKKTLSTLFSNTKYPFKLIFIDNDSKDGTLDYLHAECKEKEEKLDNFLGYSIKANNKNHGISVGRNQALALSSGNWLVTFDNDVWVPDGWLTECINILQKNKQYGAIGVNMEDKQYVLKNVNDITFQHKPQGNLGTACMVFNRALHKMLGYFSNDYEYYAHEDADWGMRTRVLGFKLGYIERDGKHLGEGSKNDSGEYREFKNKYHKENLPKFHENCRAYVNRKKSLYIPFEDKYD